MGKEKPHATKKILLPSSLPDPLIHEINVMLDLQCAGIREEITGFADALQVQIWQVMYYAMTYLEHGCSLMGCTPIRNTEAHTLLAFTFDFSDELEDIALFDTAVNGKYRHTGIVIFNFIKNTSLIQKQYSV